MMGPWRAGAYRFIDIVEAFKAAIACVHVDEKCVFRKTGTMLEERRRYATIGDASRFVTKTREDSRRFSKLLRHPAAEMARAPLM